MRDDVADGGVWMKAVQFHHDNPYRIATVAITIALCVQYISRSFAW